MYRRPYLLWSPVILIVDSAIMHRTSKHLSCAESVWYYVIRRRQHRLELRPRKNIRQANVAIVARPCIRYGSTPTGTGWGLPIERTGPPLPVVVRTNG